MSETLLIAITTPLSTLAGVSLGWVLNSRTTRDADRREALRAEMRRDLEPLREFLKEATAWRNQEEFGLISRDQWEQAGFDSAAIEIISKSQTAIFGAEPQELRDTVVEIARRMMPAGSAGSAAEASDSGQEWFHDLLNKAHRIVRQAVADAGEER